MLSTLSKTQRHDVASLVKLVLWYITQECLVESLQWLILVSKDIPSSRLTFINTQVVVTVYQRASETREEYTNLKLWHIGVLLYQAVVVAIAVKEQQMVFLAQRNTTLVQDTIAQSYIFSLCL